MAFEKDIIERKQSELHYKYGVHIDSTLIVFFLILEEKYGKDSEELRSAVAKIKNSQKTLQVQNNTQAFWHGFGMWGVSSIVAAILVVVIFLRMPSKQLPAEGQQFYKTAAGYQSLIKVQPGQDPQKVLRNLSGQIVIKNGEYYLKVNIDSAK